MAPSLRRRAERLARLTIDHELEIYVVIGKVEEITNLESLVEFFRDEAGSSDCRTLLGSGPSVRQ